MRLVCIFVFGITFAGSLDAADRTVFAEDKLSIELPDGWKKSQRNEGVTLGGWESPDQTTSVFFQKMNVNSSVAMAEILDGIVDNFSKTETMRVHKVDQYKSGEVNGTDKKYPAIFTTLDVTLQAKPKDFDIKFYVFVFDTGSAQYFMQGSCVKPVWDVREKQMMSLIRSLVARK